MDVHNLKLLKLKPSGRLNEYRVNANYFLIFSDA